jgi:hypothetical protein
MVLPPVTSFLGARPSQEQKCLTVGHLDTPCVRCKCIGTNLSEDGLSDGNADTVNSSPVDTRNADQRSAQVVIVTGRILGVRTVLFLGKFIGAIVRPIGADECVGALDCSIASLNLSCVEIVEFESLLEDEEMFVTPGAGKRFGDLGFVFLAAILAQFC